MSNVIRKPVMSYANNKAAEQPAHQRSLISTFVVHCLSNILSILTKCKILWLWLVPVAEQADLSLTWSQPPEDRFSHDVAQFYIEE